jgi:hypothetical protein
LGRECTKPKYRNGCDDRKKERQWECVRTNMNGGGWKIRKCRGNEEHKEEECQCREKKQGRRKRMVKEMPWKEEEMEEEEEFFKEVMHEVRTIGNSYMHLLSLYNTYLGGYNGEWPMVSGKIRI